LRLPERTPYPQRIHQQVSTADIRYQQQISTPDINRYQQQISDINSRYQISTADLPANTQNNFIIMLNTEHVKYHI
jgi:hypothetical protein